MNSPQHTVFIGNLPFSTSKMDLQALFETFGTITNIHIPVNKETGQARGFAFVSFEAEHEAQEALNLNGQDVKGRAIKVHLAHNNSQNGGGAPRPNNGPRRRPFGEGNRFESRGGSRFNRS